MLVALYSTLYYTGYYLALFLTPWVLYLVLVKSGGNDGDSETYKEKDLFYPIKYLVAKRKVKTYQKRWKQYMSRLGDKIETDIFLPNIHHVNAHNIYGVDQKGNSLTLQFSIEVDNIVEIFLCLRLEDGSTYVFPEKTHTCETNIAKQQWKAKGLEIAVLEPFQRLRVIYNGLLQGPDKVEHVKFNFIFNAAASPMFTPQDQDSALFIRSLATEPWSSWKNMLVEQTGYDQFGALKGIVRVGSAEHTLNLPCCRCKQLYIGDQFVTNRMLKIYMADEYGNLIHVVLKSFKNGCSQLNYGSVFTSANKQLQLKGIDIRLTDIAKHKVIPEMLTIHVRVENKVFKCIVHMERSRIVFGTVEKKYGHEIFNVPAECDVNAFQGRAIVEFWYSMEGEGHYIPLPRLSDRTITPLPTDLIADIRSETAQILDLTGGKGNSLALLASLDSADFTVPQGFIVTTNSYKQHMAANVHLQKSITSISLICYGKAEGKLEDVCKETVETFKKSTLVRQVEEAIKKQLQRYDHDMRHGWAVRSSAIGEDSEELSAAGQNETFLGCQSVEEILDAVLACWASLYSYQSVQYRWQHGLPVSADMAVVIQQMVSADCAGVLFTCHPSTHNPSEMVITSNFGLGETVVSGVSDPDTFILNRTWEGKMTVNSTNAGLKNKIMKMSSEGVQEVTGGDDNTLSLSEMQMLLLGRVGVALEETFGNPRDIEWAFSNNVLYLLQSRPITTLSTWTDFELNHETDSPILTEKSVLTVANVKEVMPNGMTVLSETGIVRRVGLGVQTFAQQSCDPYGVTALWTYQHNVMVDVVCTIHRNVKEEVKVSSLILDLAFFGHPVLDETLNHIVINRLGITPTSKILSEIFRAIKTLRNNKHSLEMATDVAHQIDLDVGKDTPALLLYNKINHALDQLETVALCHSKTTSVSVLYQIVAINVLLEKKNELSPEHYADFAAILSSCDDVISAEIPSYLEAIAKIVRDHGLAREFCNTSHDEAVMWMQKRCPEAYSLFCEFLKKHGHRNLGEFEVLEKSWAEDPTQLIPMLQGNARSDRNATHNKETVDEVVKRLQSPTSNVTLCIIKYLIKKIRVAVGIREQTKAEFVRAMDKIRMGYRHLGEQMVREGFIPSKDLVYHFTHYELGELINERNSGLVTKAFRRQRLYLKWKKLKFPEVMYGIPTPENAEQSKIPYSESEHVCSGTPVCTGVVKARACVINSLDDIEVLQTGDILITYSTDIGWSPYFPMLSGLVTELGGLVSHGAVVAREYGLPCIVGVKDATRYFTTGDIILLNGDIGVLGRAL